MQFFTRDLAKIIGQLSSEYACLLVTGARQSGKTTLLRSLMNPKRKYVSLDDLDERKLAKQEPATFLALHGQPILIDEVQYAPELFSVIKMAIDNGAAPGSFWLTGSQVFSLMQLSQESLAGRVAILRLPMLSQHEIYGEGTSSPFLVDFNALATRTGQETDLQGIYERIWNGSMPAFVSGRYTDRAIYYASYLETYLSRDVGDILTRFDKMLFNDFLRAAACRVGQLLNIHNLATDIDVTDDTARRWLEILERSDVIFYLHPYFNNLLKRTVKQKKLYFCDTGLVAYLTKFPNAETLAHGALNGAILENYVVSEIRKTYLNAGREAPLWYYRDRDKKEIDLIIEANGFLHPLEIKRTLNPSHCLKANFSVLDHGAVP
ncbi:MAG: ATP-binding protein, partial [Desulfovibrionaceae bacterium]|nr:ATP-binding protein [Desulfovibrionaceae bacterium]